MLSKTAVNQTTMFEGKCDWERPYWRCLTAPHQWLDLKECQRDSFHTQLLKRKGAFFVPVTGDPGSHGCSKLPCSISSMAFTGWGILQLSELLFPAVSGEPWRQADKRGNAPLTPPWALPWGVRHQPGLPTSQTASQLRQAQFTRITALLTSTPVRSVCLKMWHTAHHCLPNAHNSNDMLSTSSGMKQTDPAQSLSNCHFGWRYVFICHQSSKVQALGHVMDLLKCL